MEDSEAIAEELKLEYELERWREKRWREKNENLRKNQRA